MSVAFTSVDVRLDIGKVFQQTIEVLKRNIATFGGMALLMAGLPSAINSFSQAMSKAMPLLSVVTGVVAIAGFVATLILQGALMYGSVQDLNGSPASAGDCLKVGVKNWLPLLGLFVLMGLGFMLGAILLIVPGVLLALRWAVSGPVLVMEGRGITDAMDRSVTLTKGRRWGIFLLFLVLWIAALILEGLTFSLAGGTAGLQAAAVSGHAVTATLMLGPIFSVLSNLIGPVFIAALYHQLRATREGGAPESLAQVFA
jgi:hypothetical protein